MVARSNPNNQGDKSSRAVAMMCGVSLALSVVAIMVVLFVWWYQGRILNTRMLQIDSPDGSKVVITSDGFDAPTMLFYDSNDRVRMESGLAKNGSPYLRMLGADGSRIIVMDTLTETGVPQFFMRDPNDQQIGWRAVLEASAP